MQVYFSCYTSFLEGMFLLCCVIYAIKKDWITRKLLTVFIFFIHCISFFQLCWFVKSYSASVAISLSIYAWWLCAWQVAGCSAQWQAIVSGFWVSGLRSEEAYGFISWVYKRSATSKSEWLLWFSYLSLCYFKISQLLLKECARNLIWQ